MESRMTPTTPVRSAASTASDVLRAQPGARVRSIIHRASRGSRRAPWFLTNRAAGNRDLLRLLAFGIVPDESRARSAVERAETARASWITEHGSEALDDAELDALLGDVVRTTIARAEHPLVVGLTSGFDSRPLLHHLQSLGLSPKLYCYSQPGNIDHDVVMWLDERLGLGVELADTRTIAFSLEIYDAHARTQNPSPLGAGAPGWAWARERFGRSTILHGYLNDTLTGDNREKTQGAAQLDDHSAFMARNDPFGLQSEFDGSVLSELCPSEAVSLDGELDTYTQLDLAYRQENRIKPQPGGPHELLYPFEDERWIGYWLSRPREERRGQRRWYEYVKSLRSPLFADLEGLAHLEAKELRLARKRRFYGHKGASGLLDLSTASTPLQREPAHPFDLVAVYAANPSLRTTVAESLKRLRGRGLVYGSVINAVQHRFSRGDHAAGLLVNGLITIDVHAEVGAV